MAFATFESERLANRVERLLVIGPLSAFEAWREEATDCFVEPLMVHVFDGGKIPASAEVVLVNYQRLTSNYDALAGWVSARPSMVILDEAHRMKRGWNGQWGTAYLNLAYLAERRDILTGTPAPQSPKDFVALLKLLVAHTSGADTPSSSHGAYPTCKHRGPGGARYISTVRQNNQTAARPSAGLVLSNFCAPNGSSAGDLFALRGPNTLANSN